jgi:hypothetical protein
MSVAEPVGVGEGMFPTNPYFDVAVSPDQEVWPLFHAENLME